MARRFIVENIVNLIKAIGGNPNKFMGTKSNITFLGKGPKGSLFQGQVDIRGLADSGFPIEQVISEAETAGGYAVANKLNDIQLQRLEQNLTALKKLYAPDPIPNITDMATGTRDLTAEGLGSLREGLRRFPEETHQFMGRPLKEADFAKIDQLVAEGKIPDAEGVAPLMTRISDRMKNIKEMSDELGNIAKGETTAPGTFKVLDPTAEKTSYASRFNPRNEIHVNKAEALLKDPQIKGLYTEAEVKNAYDFEGLYQSHFDKGHVDVARLLEIEGHNIPQMRASARDALLQLLKKEKGLPGAESGLRDFVSAEDFKFISEGGGGRAGDPINLMVKYFGKNATENLPKNATKENIDVFTDFIMAAKDSRGRGINDPFFEREAIDFSEFTRSIGDYVPPFAVGGRVDTGGLGEILQVPRTSFKWGSGLSKALLKRINKKMIKDAVDDIFPTGNYKMDAEIAAEALVENNPRLFGGKLIDDLDDAARSDVYGLVLGEVTARFGLNLKKQRGIKSLLKNVNEQFGEGTLKRASELPKGTKYETLEAIKDFEARNRTFTPNREMIRTKYQGKIDDDLLDKILVDNNPQRIAEILATIDEALLMQGRGMGSQDIMAALRGSWGRKKSASGGLAKILEV